MRPDTRQPAGEVRVSPYDEVTARIVAEMEQGTVRLIFATSVTSIRPKAAWMDTASRYNDFCSRSAR